MSVLIMDEVDGMSAGDRGGAKELSDMIEKSKVKKTRRKKVRL
jgi:replication factor C subunit 1